MTPTSITGNFSFAFEIMAFETYKQLIVELSHTSISREKFLLLRVVSSLWVCYNLDLTGSHCIKSIACEWRAFC